MKTFIIFLFIIASFQHVSASNSIGDPIDEYQKRQELSSPDSVMKWLIMGNQRFAKGLATHGGYFRDARKRVQISSLRQRPLAAVLSCIDSRTAPEVVFDTSVGDLFTSRIAGNVVGHDILGSLEVSVASGVKIIVVLGHKDCGAVKGACHGYEFEHLTRVLEKVKPAIAKTNIFLDRNPDISKDVGERIPENPKYIAQVGHTNALQSVDQILARSSFLRNKVESGELKIISGLYDVSTGKVKFERN